MLPLDEDQLLSIPPTRTEASEACSTSYASPPFSTVPGSDADGISFLRADDDIGAYHIAIIHSPSVALRCRRTMPQGERWGVLHSKL